MKKKSLIESRSNLIDQQNNRVSRSDIKFREANREMTKYGNAGKFRRYLILARLPSFVVISLDFGFVCKLWLKMGDLRESFEDVGDEIQIGILADEGAKAVDQDLIRFEEAFRQLQLQQRLTLEAEVRRNKLVELNKIGVVDNPQDLVDKVLKATLKRDESSQIHLICQKVNCCFDFCFDRDWIIELVFCV